MLDRRDVSGVYWSEQRRAIAEVLKAIGVELVDARIASVEADKTVTLYIEDRPATPRSYPVIASALPPEPGDYVWALRIRGGYVVLGRESLASDVLDYVPLDGSEEMTGTLYTPAVVADSLVMRNAPTNAGHTTRKSYVDEADAAIREYVDERTDIRPADWQTQGVGPQTYINQSGAARIQFVASTAAGWPETGLLITLGAESANTVHLKQILYPIFNGTSPQYRIPPGAGVNDWGPWQRLVHDGDAFSKDTVFDANFGPTRQGGTLTANWVVTANNLAGNGSWTSLNHGFGHRPRKVKATYNAGNAWWYDVNIDDSLIRTQMNSNQVRIYNNRAGAIDLEYEVWK